MSVSAYIPSRRELNPANCLTVIRLFGIIPLAPWMFMHGIYAPLSVGRVGLFIFLALALTDFFDGLLARHCGWTTPYGRRMDRKADKWFAFYSLAWLGFSLVPNVAAVLVALFLAAVILRLLQDWEGNRLNNLHPKAASNIWGKIKAWVDDAAIAAGYLLLILAHRFGWSFNWSALAASCILFASAGCAHVSLQRKRRLAG